MSKLLLSLILLCSSSFALGSQFKEASGWALMGGYGNLNDGFKKAEALEPTGTTFKGAWTHRTKYFDKGLMVRHGKFTDELTYEDIKADFSHSDLTLGVMGSFWLFSWFNVHGGYAYHTISERVSGDFTDNEQTEVEEKYNINRTSVFGLYGGADLVLFQTKSFQLFLNYDYYHLNGLRAHQWEAMAGFRFYTSSSNVGKGNFFVKFFREIFKPKDK